MTFVSVEQQQQKCFMSENGGRLFLFVRARYFCSFKSSCRRSDRRRGGDGGGGDGGGGDRGGGGDGVNAASLMSTRLATNDDGGDDEQAPISKKRSVSCRASSSSSRRRRRRRRRRRMALLRTISCGRERSRGKDALFIFCSCPCRCARTFRRRRLPIQTTRIIIGCRGCLEDAKNDGDKPTRNLSACKVVFWIVFVLRTRALAKTIIFARARKAATATMSGAHKKVQTSPESRFMLFSPRRSAIARARVRNAN